MPNDKEFELDDLESFSFDDLSLDDTPSPDADPAPASGEDPFGVWVKSAPEDVTDGEAPSPEEAVAEDGLPEEDFLSTEELANLDDSFDFVTVDEPLEGESPEDEPLEDEIAFLDTPEAVAAEKSAAEGASFDEVSLDDFVSFDDVTTDDTAASETLADGPETEEDANEEFLDIDIDIEDDIGDEELEIIEGAAPRAEPKEAPAASHFAAQDVDLSEFGDFEEVAAGPALSDDLTEVDLPDLPDMADLPDMDELTPPEEMGLADLPGEEEIEEGFFEETVLDESLPTLEDEGEVSLDLEPDDQTDLDHIMALEEDLTSGIREPDAPAPAAPAAASSNAIQDVAAAILGKIEQELSSIKQEITALKNEVTHLRAAPEAAPVAFEAPAETPAPSEDEQHAQPRGFFDEEEDETIALTGDELDNIFSSAEISESEEQGETLDEDIIGMDAEGNLIEPAPELEEDLHVSDEEFLAGTSLDLNAPDPLADAVADATEISDELGIPDSIELEDSLPLELDEGETEDLLGSEPSPEFALEDEIEPLPPGVMEASPEPLEIPFDEDIDLADDSTPLAPELNDELVADSLDSIESLPEIAMEPSDGWSPPAPEDEVLVADSEPLDLEPEPRPVPAAPAPTPPPAVPAGAPAPLPANLKTELKAVLQYMDKLLASLPDDKIQEFAESEHFEVYKRLFEELGLIE